NFAVGVGPEASLKIHEYEDGYKNFVFSGVGGIEYTLWDDFFIDVRFDYGFMNITDDDNPWEAKNQNIQFGFGVKI
ncbi:MAG: outer membrane beta-barrel protein, partial [Mangrovimonas sp.]|nr:outer membrane beta-barrel protein [Mangrovimonas sp.]